MAPLGSRYGWISTPSTLRCRGISSEKKQEVPFTLMCNTSICNTLEPGCLYGLRGSLIAREDGTDPRFFYFHICVLPLGPIGKIPVELGNKTSITGLGHVIKRTEVEAPQQSRKNWLEVIVKHNGYDYEKRAHIPFSVKYLVSSQPNLVNTHVLYQVGREVEVNGMLVDWDETNNRAVVLVDSVSIISGSDLPAMSSETQFIALIPYIHDPSESAFSEADSSSDSPIKEEDVSDYGPPSVSDEEHPDVDSKSFSEDPLDKKPAHFTIQAPTTNKQGPFVKKRKYST
ncbi:hypothetical protein PTTG_12737 [Puccinia triticina 1-1 BBBD Race 1]|uniref:Uncharacterized protein n=1 Tax=Puccinia triticina (isolate 1-1 / race 1 (BBBD)) TaxID=630390 RepID=A0A180G9X2_PUCT1|nr:hypothetical protein PTTG_12737 [Puccinia triticina 1-1 BBBD Race 1]